MSTTTVTAARSKTVLVTGATGKVGRRLVRHLLDDGHHGRALTRRPDTAGPPAEVDLRTGDPGRPQAVTEAARGADATFWNWMGFDGDGAREAVSAMAGELEQVIEATGVDRTFLRAGGFAANALAWAEAIRAGEPVPMPYPEAVRPSVHEADVAEVAWRCLVEPHHRGRAYEITGPEQLTRRDEAAAIGRAIGHAARPFTRWAADHREDFAPRRGRDR